MVFRHVLMLALLSLFLFIQCTKERGPGMFDASCSSTWEDNNNCGACGHACPNGSVCVEAQCTCRDHYTCDGVCADLEGDPQNCGACGNVCLGGTVCIAGKCWCPVVGQDSCNGECVDVLSNSSHCGNCQTVCNSTQICSNGGCCEPGQSFCGGTCIDVLNDTNNCGRCGKVCGPSAACVNGQCTCEAVVCCQKNNSFCSNTGGTAICNYQENYCYREASLGCPGGDTGWLQTDGIENCAKNGNNWLVGDYYCASMPAPPCP
jgi:hypothetical protein